jgi:alkylhydroperoxidase family enzyme
MRWLRDDDAPTTSLEELLGLRPDLSELYQDLFQRLWTATGFDPVLLELCRIRQAQLLGCDAEAVRRTPFAVDDGLDEALIGSLSSWPTSPAFSPAAKACLAYTEAFVIDPHGVDDQHADVVREETGESGLVALTMALGLFDGLCRLRLSLEDA